MATFRETLRTLLVQKDISLADLASRSGIAYQTLKGFTSKTAARKPSVPVLIAISKSLEISLDQFRDCDDLQMKKPDEKEEAE
ncbi:helix-turn-helix domain-containing protein [Gemmata obscuriglobus]|nr:helix-turn-helix transcriptional regulator [Gemmata obscuriglobus]